MKMREGYTVKYMERRRKNKKRCRIFVIISMSAYLIGFFAMGISSYPVLQGATGEILSKAGPWLLLGGAISCGFVLPFQDNFPGIIEERGCL